MRQVTTWSGGAIVVVLGVLQAACMTSQPVVTDIRLSNVRRPADVEERWGDYEISEAEEEGFVYEDDLVRVLSIPLDPSFHLTITNKTDQSMQLLWDQMSFVRPDGSATRVSSGEQSFAEVGDSQPPTPIPANSRVEIIAIPISQIRSQFGNTGIDPLYSAADSAAFSEIPGHTMRLVVPLEVEGTVNEYTFLYEVRDIGFASDQAEED